MQRVRPKNLQVGMIVVEPILNMDGTVLLAANSKLTKSNIDLLQTWDIDFIRIREPRDTDQSIERELKREKELARADEPGPQIDPVIAAKIGISEQAILHILKGDIFGTTAAWQSERSETMGSLATEEGIQLYWKFIATIDKLLMVNSRDKEFSIKEFNELAKLVTDYVWTTPGVVGYVFRPQAEPVNELARHLIGTAVISGKLAMLLNYSLREINNVIMAGLIHDIGKIGFPDKLIIPTKPLTPTEEALYQTHVQLGLARIKNRNWIPKEVLLAMAQHHEMMDGSGFPTGFRGDKIHPYARIVALADHVDYSCRHESDISDLIKAIPFLAGRYDPNLCAVLREYLGDFLLSNILKLDDGRSAQIVFRHQAFAEPVIRTNDGEFIDLNVSDTVKIERYSI